MTARRNLMVPGVDLYLRLEDPTGKRPPSYRQHRCWDAERFLETMKKTHHPKAKDPDLRLHVHVITRAEYREATWPKRTNRKRK